MNDELALTLAVSALGLAQVYLSSKNDKLLQIHRNFDETYFVVIICFLITELQGGGGTQAVTAACFYLAGRFLYLFLSLLNQPNMRKLAWVASMVGVIGWVLVAVKTTAQHIF